MFDRDLIFTIFDSRLKFLDKFHPRKCFLKHLNIKSPFIIIFEIILFLNSWYLKFYQQYGTPPEFFDYLIKSFLNFSNSKIFKLFKN